MSSSVLTSSTVASSAPIGIFDSGVGGLSVYMKIRELMPNEEVLYVADSRYAPYGSKSPEFVQERVFKIADFLVEKGVKAIVVACNTATAVAVSSLRERLDIPVIGIEPAVKPAAALSKTGVVGVLATAGTIASDKFTRLVEAHGQEVRVINQPCHGLVEQVESGELDSPETQALLEQYIVPLLEQGADVLVLGCTHYPFLMEQIQLVAGDDVKVIETGTPVAEELKRRLNSSINFYHNTGEVGCQIFANIDTEVKQQHIEAVAYELLTGYSVMNFVEI